MNILTDTLPDTITIGKRKCRIETDFRPCLKTIMACEDDTLTRHEKAQVILTNLFPTNNFFSDPESALEKAQWFLDGGRTSAESSDTDTAEAPMRLYSFTKDANFIYAAFRQTHGIDLSTIKMHWWVFLALFLDLGSETTFCQLIALRKRIKSGKASKEERAYANEIKDILDLEEPDVRTLSEREAEAEFMDALKEARNKQK